MATPMELEDAQARLLALATPLPVERVDVTGSLGRFLAEPLRAKRTQPAADLSAMDGYAVAADDLAGPWQITGESAAGHPFAGTISRGEAARISTGALIPAGATTVILQEDSKREGSQLHLTGTPPEPPERHIRREGMDFIQGDKLLSAGSYIGPAQVALAISAGMKHLAVCRLPRITIIDCGDELAAEPDCCALHQIPASNGAMLAAMASSIPSKINRLGPISDNMTDLESVLEQASAADVIVTTGGASVGDHDLIRPALERWGATLDFWKVAIKPGKPLLVARKGHQIILGLPGNPVSSYVTAHLFLLPLMRRLLGATSCLPRRVATKLSGSIHAGGARREFQRGYWDGATFKPQAQQDSGALAALAASNALIDRAATAPAGHIGDDALIYLLENGGVA